MRECWILEKMSLKRRRLENGTDVAQIKASVANWSNYLSNSPNAVGSLAARRYRVMLIFAVYASRRLPQDDRVARRVENRGTSRVRRDVESRIPAARARQRPGLSGA
ncbi:hypothetical protein MPLA_1650075 [Mesorhizobium sp. ORS 3359]|nr:hypothetical protein MPLA_1650075 [Mesorhizobium sp. ORS 3359]